MFLIVLSPAKTLDMSPSFVKDYTKSSLSKDTKILLGILKKLSSNDLQELMGISQALADLNYLRYQQFVWPFTLSNSKQALLAFKGDVYKGINLDQFTSKDYSFTQQSVRILSGLYGCLRPLDLIQPYRLEMKTTLKNPLGKNLYAFWKKQLVATLNAEIAALDKQYIVNLASDEYFKALDVKSLSVPVLKVAFKENKKGSYKVVAILAKKARGKMVNFVIKHKIQALEGLKSFDCDGYTYQEKLSNKKEWVFVRD